MSKAGFIMCIIIVCINGRARGYKNNTFCSIILMRFHINIVHACLYAILGRETKKASNPKAEGSCNANYCQLIQRFLVQEPELAFLVEQLAVRLLLALQVPISLLLRLFSEPKAMMQGRIQQVQ